MLHVPDQFTSYQCQNIADLRLQYGLLSTLPVSFFYRTPSMTMAPATDALSVPEILESIILNLPLRQIVLSRATCREFQRVIDSTTAIQQALFRSQSPQKLYFGLDAARPTQPTRCIR